MRVISVDELIKHNGDHNVVVDSFEAIPKNQIDNMTKELESMHTEDVEFTHGLIQNGVLLDDVLKIVHKYCDIK